MYTLTLNQRHAYKDVADAARVSDNHTSSFTALTPTSYQTPREVKEERWRLEIDATKRSDKLEMREMYKELGGRKPRTKGKLLTGIGGGGHRDRGGWDEFELE